MKLLQSIADKGGIFELLRFVVVGGLATLTDLAVTALLYYGAGLESENLISTLAFLTAFFVSYFGHRSFTFKSQGSALKYFALAAAMQALRNLIILFLVQVLALRGLPPMIIAMVLVTGITYVCSKYLVFKARGLGRVLQFKFKRIQA